MARGEAWEPGEEVALAWMKEETRPQPRISDYQTVRHRAPLEIGKKVVEGATLGDVGRRDRGSDTITATDAGEEGMAYGTEQAVYSS